MERSQTYMLLTQTEDPERWLVNMSVALVLCGTLFLLYGTVMTTPVLYGALLSLHASILGGATPSAAPAILPGAPEPLFLAGCLLIIGGVFIDVSRRLRKLGH